MQEQLSDGPAPTAALPVSSDDAGNARRRRRSRRTDWRLGGTAVRRWDSIVLAVALVSLGVGIFGGALVTLLWTSPWAPLVSSLVLWAGMLFPVYFAFRRGRPAGLLTFRPVDLLYAAALGIFLRLLQGWITDAGSRPMPSVTTLDGSLPATWFVTDALPAALIGPTIEEFFFRTVVLVAVYSALRRPAGAFAAGLGAVLVSTATFMLLHAIDGSLPLSEALPLGAVGLVCSLLVILTGRIWGAVLVHIVYNATMVALLFAGTVLS